MNESAALSLTTSLAVVMKLIANAEGSGDPESKLKNGRARGMLPNLPVVVTGCSNASLSCIFLKEGLLDPARS